MSAKTKQANQLDKINRAERLLTTIAALEQQIKDIFALGEVAPPGCHLARYQHLGAAGTESHVQGVMMVIRRNQIDELQKSIDALRDSWSDLYSDLEEKKTT